MSSQHVEVFDQLFSQLWPLCRSITGQGLRETLNVLGEYVPLTLHEIPTGTACFDWEIPQEWVIKAAWIKDSHGEKIIDFKDNNLHVVNYSVGVKCALSKQALSEYVYRDPSQETAIPYMTSYYERQWGFCMSQQQWDALPEQTYEVFIDAEHIDGSLTLAEGVLPGASDEEIVFTTYCCHPSMANNELSGPIIQSQLYRALLDRSDRRYTYRFVYAPETVGDLAFLSKRQQHLTRHMVGGAVLTMMANDAPMSVRLSRAGNSIFDRALAHVVQHRFPDSAVLPWEPVGGAAQRHYCSPGLKLPLCAIGRAFAGGFPQYHTSLDTRAALPDARIEGTLSFLLSVVEVLELNQVYVCQKPFGEPFMRKYDLAPGLSDGRLSNRGQHFRYLLQYADGEMDLMAIADQLGIYIGELAEEALTLVRAGLLQPRVPKTDTADKVAVLAQA